MNQFGKPKLAPERVKTLVESHMKNFYQDRFADWNFSSVCFWSIRNTTGVVKNSWTVEFVSETLRMQNIHPEHQIVDVCDETQTVTFRTMM